MEKMIVSISLWSRIIKIQCSLAADGNRIKTKMAERELQAASVPLGL